MRFDLSDEEWAVLEPLMPEVRKSGRAADLSAEVFAGPQPDRTRLQQTQGASTHRLRSGLAVAAALGFPAAYGPRTEYGILHAAAIPGSPIQRSRQASAARLAA